MFQIECLSKKHRRDLQYYSVYVQNLEDANRKLSETITSNLTGWPPYLFQELRPQFSKPFPQPPPIQHGYPYSDQGEEEEFIPEEFLPEDQGRVEPNHVGIDQQVDEEETVPEQKETETVTDDWENVEPTESDNDNENT